MATDAPSADTFSPPIPANPAAFGREWWIVFRHELRRLLLGLRSLVPMGIYAAFAALWLWGFHYAEHEVDEQRAKLEMDDSSFQKQKEEVLAKSLSTFGWGDEGDAAEIVRDHVPFTIIAFFVLASYFLPLLVAVVSFDQFSELSTRGARYALLRVRRETYVIGKAAAAMGSVLVFLGVMWIVVAAVTGYQAGPGEIPVILREAVRAWLLMGILALPYLSITAFISALARPVLAFVMTVGAWLGLWLGRGLVNTVIPFILEKMGLESAAQGERKLLLLFPWDHAPKLISRDPYTLARGIVGLLLLALAGYAATVYVVRRRDV